MELEAKIADLSFSGRVHLMSKFFPHNLFKFLCFFYFQNIFVKYFRNFQKFSAKTRKILVFDRYFVDILWEFLNVQTHFHQFDGGK